jgi:hypothetical protein
MYLGLNIKFPLFLSHFNESYWLSNYFPQKKNQISNFIKIRPVGAELFHTEERKDRQTDTVWLTVAFPSFTTAPNMDFYGLLQGLSRRPGVPFQVFELTVRKCSYSFKNMLQICWQILPV